MSIQQRFESNKMNLERKAKGRNEKPSAPPDPPPLLYSLSPTRSSPVSTNPGPPSVPLPCRLTYQRHSTRSTTTPSLPPSYTPPYTTTLSGGSPPTFAGGWCAAGTTTLYPHTDTYTQESHKAPASPPHSSTTSSLHTPTPHTSQHPTLMTLQTLPPTQTSE